MAPQNLITLASETQKSSKVFFYLRLILGLFLCIIQVMNTEEDIIIDQIRSDQIRSDKIRYAIEQHIDANGKFDFQEIEIPQEAPHSVYPVGSSMYDQRSHVYDYIYAYEVVYWGGSTQTIGACVYVKFDDGCSDPDELMWAKPVKAA